MQETDYFLVILVDARHLDYSNAKTFIKTMRKHPDDCSKNGDVGHAWIYLQGLKDNQRFIIEGGHSGELGVIQAKYFNGIMNNIDYGYANPSPSQMCKRTHEPNPVKYLWESQHDGYFQQGSGRHNPTFAVKVNLTQEQFEQILLYINAYHFSDYAITGNQCSSFVAQVAVLAGVDVNCHVTIPVEPFMHVKGGALHLWEDPNYSLLTVSSPDVIEHCLMQLAKEHKVEYALKWYLSRKKT